MVSLPVYLNGIRYECPASWADLSVKKYCRIFNEWLSPDIKLEDQDYFKLFCILTDSDYKTFSATTENEVEIWNRVRWVVEQPIEYPKLLPKVLQIDDKIIDIPDRVELLSIGQNIHLRTGLEGIRNEAGIGLATALFLQPLYDGGKFDPKKAEALKAKIDEMPAFRVYPIGFFLLQNALKTGSTGGNFLSRMINNLTTRLGSMLPAWRGRKGLDRSMT